MTKYLVYTGDNREDITYLGSVEASNHNVAENKAERKFSRDLLEIMVIIPKSSAHVSIPR